MKILHLTLKKKWFDMIKAGVKKEEYREVKPYWSTRLMNDNPIAGTTSMKQFDIIRFRNGYSPDSPVIDVECLDVGISSTPKPEWSDNAQGTFYTLYLGKILNE